MQSRFAKEKKTPHERICDYYVAMAKKPQKRVTCKSNATSKGFTQYTNYEILKQLANI